MLKIKVPASSANLGCGFDSLGLALKLNNTFIFEKSASFALQGFDSSKLEDNLVYQSYHYVFEYLKKDVIPVIITLEEAQIPISRGLGSSASCIVAGVYAANYFLDFILSEEACLSIATKIEGHPDNISACALGGLVSCFVKDGIVKTVSYPVSDDIFFYLAIPNFVLSTEIARNALPKKLLISDYVHSLSRAIQLPYAFSRGDIGLLRDLLDDKIHEPYRLPLIKNADKIKGDYKDLDVAIAISGAGPSLLLISKLSLSDMHFNTKKYSDWNLIAVDVSHQGVQLIPSIK